MEARVVYHYSGFQLYRTNARNLHDLIYRRWDLHRDRDPSYMLKYRAMRVRSIPSRSIYKDVGLVGRSASSAIITNPKLHMWGRDFPRDLRNLHREQPPKASQLELKGLWSQLQPTAVRKSDVKIEISDLPEPNIIVKIMFSLVLYNCKQAWVVIHVCPIRVPHHR